MPSQNQFTGSLPVGYGPHKLLNVRSKFNKEWLWFFPFVLIASLVGSELDFSHTFTALSVGGNSNIFTHFATFNCIKFGFPCVVSALLIGSGCCFLYVILLLLTGLIWFFSYCFWPFYKYWMFLPHVFCHFFFDNWQLFFSKTFHYSHKRYKF